jgi:hypothetical protein
MTEPKQRRDLILHRPERALADEFGMTLGEVQKFLMSIRSSSFLYVIGGGSEEETDIWMMCNSRRL